MNEHSRTYQDTAAKDRTSGHEVIHPNPKNGRDGRRGMGKCLGGEVLTDSKLALFVCVIHKDSCVFLRASTEKSRVWLSKKVQEEFWCCVRSGKECCAS